MLSFGAGEKAVIHTPLTKGASKAFGGRWTQRGQAQSLDHAEPLTHLLFNEAHRGKSPQCHLVFAVLKVLTHVPASLPPVPTSIKQQRCVGSTFSSDVQSSLGAFPLRIRAAGNGNRPELKC